MPIQYHVRQSRGASAASGVACTILLFLGLWFMTGDRLSGRHGISRNASPQLLKAFPELVKTPAPAPLSFPAPVIALWVLFCTAGAVYAFWNAASGKAPPYAVVTEERADTPVSSGGNRTTTAMQELQQLREQNLISEEEFQSLRNELLNRLVQDPAV